MRVSFTIILLSVASWAMSQDMVSMTLEECVKYALENSNQLRITSLEKEISDAEVRKTISRGLPQANINGGLNYNFEPQKSLIDISTFDPSVPVGTEQEVSFAQNYDGRIGLTVEQLLFDGSYFVGLQAAKTYRELSSKEHVKTQIDIVEAVSKAYYNTLIVEERYSLVESNMARLDTLIFETEQIFKAGFAEKVDVDRIKVNYNNLSVEKTRLSQFKSLSKKLLKFQMGMELNQPLSLSESLEDINVSSYQQPSSAFDYNERIEFSQLQTNRSLVYLDMKNNKVQYLPKFNAVFGYGYNTASSSSSNLFEGDRWLNNGLIGITASIPVFDGFLKSNKIQQNKLQVKQIENQMDFLQKNIDIEIEQAGINLNSQLDALNVQSLNVELAQDVYDIAKTKYKEGVGSNLEVITADTSLKEAQTNYLNSLYEALTSQIELKKALGTLYKTN